MDHIPSGELYYSDTHEWAHVDESLVTIGLTAFRLGQLGEILFLDLPDEGKPVARGESFFSIESVKRIHDFASPVTGTLVEVNQLLFENPSILNDDPYNEGWIIRVEMDNEKDLATLVRSTEYNQRISLVSKPVAPELSQFELRKAISE